MSIFQREGDAESGAGNPSRSRLLSSGNQTTVVAAGSRVHGEISGATDVLIDGRVEGQVVLGSSVVVGEGGEVQGKIQARRVKIGGKVKGDIKASERIEVLASGRIEGDVSAPRVAINAGAFFKGQVEMTSEAPKAEPTRQPEQQRPTEANADEAKTDEANTDEANTDKANTDEANTDEASSAAAKG